MARLMALYTPRPSSNIKASKIPSIRCFCRFFWALLATKGCVASAAVVQCCLSAMSLMPGGEERGAVVVFPVLANVNFCIASDLKGLGFSVGL